jgi:GNAT superfamily N-acetyltransferase
MFCTVELAARIERAEADLMARSTDAARRRRPEVGGFVVPVAGGVATYAGPGSPFDKVAGLGFAGVPSVDELEAIEGGYAERGADVQVELSTLADPAIGQLLTGRGYRLVGFEDVRGLALARYEGVRVDGVEVRASPDEEIGDWLDLVVDGFAHPDGQGVASHEDFPRDVIAAAVRDMGGAGVARYAAVREGALAGGASLRVWDGVAQLVGAATAPAHRRRGVQTALLSARLVDAVAAGCELAVVTTQPGSGSAENAHRRGFSLLYTRALLVREPRQVR